MVELNLKFPSQSDRRGLGHGACASSLATSEHRHECGLAVWVAVKKLEEEKLLAHSAGLPLTPLDCRYIVYGFVADQCISVHLLEGQMLLLAP
jgi:hypothetical protein